MSPNPTPERQGVREEKKTIIAQQKSGVSRILRNAVVVRIQNAKKTKNQTRSRQGSTRNVRAEKADEFCPRRTAAGGADTSFVTEQRQSIEAAALITKRAKCFVKSATVSKTTRGGTKNKKRWKYGKIQTSLT